MKAQYLYDKLEQYFRPKECTDIVQNGVQYHNTEEISKVYTSTFAAESVISGLLNSGEHNIMLFTHHPLPQRKAPDYKPAKIPAALLKSMKKQELSLFSYHIPLDRNGEYSPGNSLAKAMGITPYEEFYLQNNVLMGVLCNSHMNTVEEVRRKLEAVIGHEAKAYTYGDEELKKGRMAIMAGGASNPEIYEYLANKDINAFITGVTNPLKAEWIKQNHKRAKQYGINLIGGTHCSTEKFACIAMVDFFKKMGLEAEFIDEEPDLFDL